MKIWSGSLPSYENISEYCMHITSAPIERCLLFDIETTGFSPNNSLCYMIGMCYYKDSVWNYRMLFNEDGRSEYDILTEFLTLLKDYELLIHYNGDTFDLPYLKEKIRQYQSFGMQIADTDELSRIHSLDLYKLMKPYKQGLNLPNLKLSTLEQAMGFTRSDLYNGGELIPIYKKYLLTGASELEHHLYQHNYEDILAMIPMLKLLHYQALREHSLQILSVQKTDTEIIVCFSFPYALPLPYEIHSEESVIHCEGDTGELRILLRQETMYYFLENWKDYYYLPLEDKVIHKSVAAYVDSEYKTKAKKQQCYLSNTGIFLPVPAKHPILIDEHKKTESFKLYRTTPQSKNTYIEFNESCLTKEFLNAYIQTFFL